jgi:hypothetical protein
LTPISGPSSSLVSVIYHSYHVKRISLSFQIAPQIMSATHRGVGISIIFLP